MSTKEAKIPTMHGYSLSIDEATQLLDYFLAKDPLTAIQNLANGMAYAADLQCLTESMAKDLSDCIIGNVELCRLLVERAGISPENLMQNEKGGRS